jgi:hypothetical protein
MVDTEFDTAFCLVQLSDDTIKIKGFGTEISAKLNFQAFDSAFSQTKNRE